MLRVGVADACTWLPVCFFWSYRLFETFTVTLQMLLTFHNKKK